MIKTLIPNPSWRMVTLSPKTLGLILVAILTGACGRHPAEPMSGGSEATPHAGHVVSSEPRPKATPRVPDYFANPEDAKPFPATLEPKTFTAASVIKAYQLAKDIPGVLAQQPCYCYCDAGFAHKSLLHCHVDDHSAT